ncbi:hypothetical protein PDJAM_G00256090 [Pangasius djambal]|uniref:Uncharacterized protein n=1 Tax=Pangasius djambal TaxID=1691987 RepID=A0ACC5YKG5_9TELE|nr:hypothetical protein [Pangasius djambal]
MLLFERMVVKYASAIGHTFTTELLQNILPKLDLPVTLRSLFKGGVFKCASEPRNRSSTKTCYCGNSPEGEYTWVSPDPVWTCRLMTFCNKDEMEMVHKLIQANEYLFRMIHIKCANYLEKKAYRCSECDNDKFIFGHTAATGDSNPNSNSEYLQEIYKSIRPYEIFQRQDTHLRNQMCPAEENGNNTENFLAKVNSIVTEARGRTSSCACAQLVETVLIPRVRHWRCAGDVPRTFYYLVESAAACDFLQNDARILFKAGNILEAEENFKKALKLLNCNLPRNSVAQSLKFIYEKMKKLHYRSRQFEIADRRKLARLQECIDCLSFLWQISCMRGQLKSASLAITMEINLAIQSADTFKILYSAIDYLNYSQLVAEESECRRLEAFLCTTCASLPDHPEGRRLISRLTQTLAVVKLCTGDLEQSIACTMRAQQLNEVVNRPVLDARTTAALHLPLLLTYRYRESVQQILTLENWSKEISSSVAKGWFYAACMNFLLYAGFALRPFEECLAFVEESQSDAILEADKSLRMHLYSAVALWYARLENWEKSAIFYDKAREVYAQIPTTIESISGVVMLLECSVLLLRKELTECNSQSRIALKRTRKLFSDFTQRFGKNHIFGPRVLHLNACLHHLAGSNTLMQDHLNEALLMCEKQGNLLDQKWIRQSQADWCGACSDTPAAECPTAVLSMPSWDEAAVLQPEELLKYCFHLKKQRVEVFPYIRKKL